MSRFVSAREGEERWLALAQDTLDVEGQLAAAARSPFRAPVLSADERALERVRARLRELVQPAARRRWTRLRMRLYARIKQREPDYLANRRDWARANPEKVRAARARWRAKNAAHRAAYQRAWWRQQRGRAA